MNIKTARHLLKQRTNKNFVRWKKQRQLDNKKELHHLLGSFLGGKKINDYLLIELTPQKHTDLHYKNPLTDDEFDFLLLESLESVFDYIEYLENKPKG